MSFIKHTPCPKCGSKDNLAEYNDHYYCFGCRYWKAKDDLNSIRSRLQSQQTMLSDEINLDTTNIIPQKAMQWLLQYGITQQDCDIHKLSWCPSIQGLVLAHTENYWQARNFGNGAKYLSKGHKPLLFYGTGAILVCVEDVISAIKVSNSNKDVTAIPLLGSSIPLELTETILERFKIVRLWLDRDKAIEAVKMARNLKQSNIDAETIITEKDPKEYSTQDINMIIKGKL